MSASEKPVNVEVEIPKSLWEETCEEVIHSENAEQGVGEYLQGRIEFTYTVR